MKNSTEVFFPPSLDWSKSEYLVYISRLSGKYRYGDAVVEVLKRRSMDLSNGSRRWKRSKCQADGLPILYVG